MERSFGSKYGKWIALTAVVLALVLWFVLSGGVENYRAKYEGYDLSQQIGDIGRSSTYSLYLRAHEGAPDASSDVSIPLVTVDSDGVTAQKDGLLMQSGSSATFAVTVPETGFYNIRLTYRTEAARGVDLERELRINGEVPFDGADTLTFTRLWHDGGEVRQDSQGNDIRPTQVEVFGEQTACCRDAMGYITEPYRFYFEAGESTVTLIATSEPMLLTALSLTAPEKMPDYAAYAAAQPQENSVPADFALVLEGESSTLRSSPSLYARYDRSSPATSPCDVRRTVLNYIGGDAWRDAGQWIEWDFDVPEDGLYAITLKVQQNNDAGMPSYRQIMVDGEIPFDELRLYPFPYSDQWYAETLHGADGEPYLFHLTKGTHTLTMTVKLGAIGEIMTRTEADTAYLSEIHREIVKITGTDPDYNYEYDLYRTMPGLSDQLLHLVDRLQESADLLASISNETTSMESNYRQIIDQMRFFAEDVDRIPRALSDMDNAQSNLGTYISSIEKCPLAVDYIVVHAPEAKVEITTSNFFQRMGVTVENFLASFYKDYDSVGLIVDENAPDEAEKTVLDVWIGRGTEWGEILKELADEDFTPKTGIVVNLHVLPSGQLATGSVNTILLSVTSGTAPDVALSVDYNLPGEFAFREAVVDLTQFDDFEEVASQFYESSLVPYTYRGGVYALPETMDFTVMIYRQDVMRELGIDLPETWTDLYQRVLPRLYENNMSFSLPVDTSVSSNSPGALRGFTMLLLQMGGEYYNGDGESSALDTPEAYKAFKFWTDMYANYGIDAESNFFTRIRTGTMPIGISNYTGYLQLLTSAPELYGRWSIAPVPGTVQADGTVSHAVGTTASTAGVILSQSDKQEAAWTFLKWWMSAETQTRYGRELEAILGTGARWNTANVESFFSLPWDARHAQIIKAQMESAREQMIVPGGYFTGRHIINAWNSVVVNNKDARDMLEKAVKDINKELNNKRKEFGLDN